MISKYPDSTKRSTSSRLDALRSWSTSTVGTVVTSVLTAKPKTGIWTIGATKKTGIIWRSRRICRNSLTITRQSTRTSGLPPREARRGERHRGDAVQDEGADLRPVGREALALEDDPAQDHEEVAGGNQVGDDLQPHRHDPDLEDEAGEQDRRQHRGDQAGLERERLGGGG